MLKSHLSSRILAGLLCLCCVFSLLPGNLLSVYAADTHTSGGTSLWSQVGTVDKTTGGAWQSVGGYGSEQAVFIGRNNVSGGNNLTFSSVGNSNNYPYSGTIAYYLSLKTGSNVITMDSSGENGLAQFGTMVNYWRGRDKDGNITNTTALELHEGYTGEAIQFNAYTASGTVPTEENAGIFYTAENPMSPDMDRRLIFTYKVPEAKSSTPYYFTLYTDTLSYVDGFSEDFELTFLDLNGNPLGEKIRMNTADFGKTGGYATFLVQGSFLLCFDKPEAAHFFGFSAFFFDAERPLYWKQVGEMDTATGGSWQSVGGYGEEQAILLGWGDETASRLNGEEFVSDHIEVDDEDGLPAFPTPGKPAGGSAVVYSRYALQASAALSAHTNTGADAITLSGTNIAAQAGEFAFYSDVATSGAPDAAVHLESPSGYAGTAPKYNSYTASGVTDTAQTHTSSFFDKVSLSEGMTHRTVLQFDVPSEKADKAYLFTVYADTRNYIGALDQSAELFFMDVNGNPLSSKISINAADFGKNGGYLTFRVQGSFLLALDKTESYFGLSAFFFDPAVQASEETVDEDLWKQSGAIDKTTHGKWQTEGGYGDAQAFLIGWNGAQANNETVSALEHNSNANHYLNNYKAAISSAAPWVKDTSSTAITLKDDDIWVQAMNRNVYLYRGSDEMGYPTDITHLETPTGFSGTVPTYNAYTYLGVDGTPLYTSVLPMTTEFSKRIAWRFDVPDAEQEYSFTLYADTKYTKYKVDADIRLSFVSPDGETLYSTQTISASEFGKDGAYITFKVKGSFILLLDKMAWNDSGTVSTAYFGFSGFFFDEYTAPAQPAPEAFENAPVHYAGMNIVPSEGAKGSWSGKYGEVEAILLGYKDTEAPTTLTYLHNENYNYFNKNAVHLQVESDQLFCFPNTENDNTVLYNVASGSDIAVYASGNINAGAARYPLQDGYARNIFTFSGLTADTPYLFTAYTNNGGNYNARNAGTVILTFVNADGEVVYQKQVNSADFDGGKYISFVVKNGFTLIVDKQSRCSAFGFSGFFFDSVSTNPVSGLSVTAGTAARSATLTWTETGAASTDTLVLERQAGSGAWEELTTLAPGAKTYTDTNLRSGTKYSYRIYVRKSASATYITDPVSLTTETYQTTVLTLDKDAYTVAGTDDTLTVAATLKTEAGAACAGVSVSLVVDFEHSIQNVAAVTTDANGVATFQFQPQYLGNATVTAYSEDYDPSRYAYAVSEASTLLAGETTWERPAVGYKVSDAVSPGDLISINGYGFKNKDMSLLQVRYAPHGSASVEDAQAMEIMQTDERDGYFIVTKLPEEAAGGLYDIWVDNGYGWSEPIVLNAPRPLFMSEYEVWEGQTIKISGRALESAQFGGTTATKVRLTKGSTTVYPQIVDLSPYGVEFKIPAGTPLGEYTGIEVSNDDGITWAALDSDQTLTVVAKGMDPLGTGLAWMGNFKWDKNGDGKFDVTNDVYNITNYKYSWTLDTSAIKSAISAASNAGGGVVYIPAGTYSIKNIDVPAGVVIMGAGKDKTILKYNGTAGSYMFKGADKCGFANFKMTLSNDNTRPDYFITLGHSWDESEDGVVYNPESRSASRFFAVGVAMTYAHTPYTASNHRGAGIHIIADERLLVQNCESDCYNGGFVDSSFQNKYAIIRSNNFTFDAGACYSSAHYTFWEDNTVTGYFGTDSAETNDDRNTHGICTQGFAHVENNTVKNMGSWQTGDVTNIHNDGETYLSESNDRFDFGHVLASTSNTVTVKMDSGVLQSSYATKHGYVSIVIHDGRGMGQIRKVASIDPASGVIAIEGTWSVNPDFTSRFTFCAASQAVTFYNNTDSDSAKGVYIFGDMYDTVVANHTGTDTEGVYIYAAHTWGTSSRIRTNFYTTVRDCSFSGVSARSRHVNISAGSQRMILGNSYYGVQNYGIEIRNNVLVGDPTAVPEFEDANGNPIRRTESVPANGIAFRSGGTREDNYAGDNTNILIENNLLKNMDLGISYTATERGIITEGNTFETVTVPYEQVIGDQVDPTWQMDTLVNSTDAVTYQHISAFTALWEQLDRTKYCESSLTAMDTAVASAKALSSGADQAALDAMMLQLRQSYEQVKHHYFDGGVVQSATATEPAYYLYSCGLCGETKKESREEVLWGQAGILDQTTGGLWQTKGYGEEQAILLGVSNTNRGAFVGNNYVGSEPGANGATANSALVGGKWNGNGAGVYYTNTDADTIAILNDAPGGLSIIPTSTETFTYETPYATFTNVPVELAYLEAPKNPTEGYLNCEPHYNTITNWPQTVEENSSNGTYFTPAYPMSEGMAYREVMTFTVPNADTEYYFTVHLNTQPTVNDPNADLYLYVIPEGSTTAVEKVKLNTATDIGKTGAYISFKVKGNFTVFMDTPSSLHNIFGFSAFFFDELLPYAEPEGTDQTVNASLTLDDGTIGINFGMNLSLASKQDPEAAMVFSQNGETATTVALSDAEWDKKLHWFSYGVAAKEMADTVTGQMQYTNLTGNENPYSVRTYAQNALALELGDEKLDDLLKKMVNYGAYAQQQFAYNESDLANSFLPEEERTAGMSDVTADTVKTYAEKTVVGTDVVLSQATLLLRSDTILRLSFPKASAEGMTFKYNGKTLTPTTRGSLTYVDITGIAAPDLDNVYTVEIYNESSELVSTVKYCPLAYVYSALTMSEDTLLHDTVKALYLYNQAANVYFVP